MVGRSLPAVAETAAPTTEGQASSPVVFYNARVFTAEYDHPYAEAVAIRDYRIITPGTLASEERIAVPTASKGRSARKIPHVHAVWGGINLIRASFLTRPRWRLSLSSLPGR